MAATNLTYFVGREHINDLLREAESSRRAVEARRTRSVRPSLGWLFGRTRTGVVQREPAVIAAQRAIRVQHGH